MFFWSKKKPVFTHQANEQDMVNIIRLLVESFDGIQSNRDQEIAIWAAKSKLRDFDRNGPLGG